VNKLDGVETVLAVNTETLIDQITKNTQLGLTNLVDAPFFRESKQIALVGGGPSLSKYLDELREFKGPIVACGSVHDFLVENDINMDYCIVCDPDPIVIDYMKKKNYTTRYLVASQCHPDVFEHLKFSNTHIWHAGGDNLDILKAFTGGSDVIGGGCTVGSRAIIISMCLGYNDISLFGFDSSLSKDFKHHSYEFQTNQETIGNITEIRLNSPDDAEVFHCAGYHVAQLFDIKKILELYASRVRFRIRCDGALSHLFKLGIEISAQKKET